MKKIKNTLSTYIFIGGTLGLLASIPTSASLFDKLTDLKNSVVEKVSGVGSNVGKEAGSAMESMQPGVQYKGYSEDFKGIRDMMYAGDNEKVLYIYEHAKAGKKPKKDENLPEIDFDSDSLSLLNRLEYATLSIDSGKSSISEKIFLEARNILNERDGKSEQEAITQKGLLMAGEFLSGNEELQPYEPPGYEKVLLLNYQALSYLLNGKEKAYNVSRAAIDLQNAEFKLFRDKHEKQSKELKEKTEKGGAGLELPNLNTLFDTFYSKYDKKAKTVNSAYVNPFSSYLSGVVMEFDAYANKSSVDDAKRSYKKAHNLNDQSDVIKKALMDLERINNSSSGQMDLNQRLLHLVVADGFVPEKKVAVNMLPIAGKLITIQHPIIEPIASKVASVVIQDHKGKILAKSSLIADLSAIALRDQKDNATSRNLRSMVAVLRGVVEQNVLGNLIPGAALLSMARESFSHPDTRSWASLPSAFYGARLHLPQGLKKITVTTYNKTGQRIATTKVGLNDNHNFIYMRSVDDNLSAQKAKTLWVEASIEKQRAQERSKKV